jgi:uncharacterized DUF497 family protein
MDVYYTLNGCDFVWDAYKARANIQAHGVRFEEACEVFFDPFYLREDASRHHEDRSGLIGYSESGQILYVVSTEQGDDAWHIISARKATKQEKQRYEKENAFK